MTIIIIIIQGRGIFFPNYWCIRSSGLNFILLSLISYRRTKKNLKFKPRVQWLLNLNKHLVFEIWHQVDFISLTWDIGSLLKHRIWPFCFLCHRIELYHFQFLKEAGNKNRRFELTNCDHDKGKTLKSVSWERLTLVNVNSNTFKQSYCWIWSKKENWGLFGLPGFLLKSF